MTWATSLKRLRSSSDQIRSRRMSAKDSAPKTVPPPTESGKVSGGTGEFEHASGTLGIQGSFTAGYDADQQYPWLWIAMVNGSVCRVK